MYANNQLERWLKELNDKEKRESDTLTKEENILMKILEYHSAE